MTTAEQTQDFAARLGALLQPSDILLLQGELGAGKTTFTQGLARGLDIQQSVTSPTFTLVQEYRGGRLPLFHFDPYRLDGWEDIADLGFEEYLEYGGVVVVEWAERLEALTPEEFLHVQIAAEQDDTRSIQLSPLGGRYERLVRELEAGEC